MYVGVFRRKHKILNEIAYTTDLAWEVFRNRIDDSKIEGFADESELKTVSMLEQRDA